MSAKIRSDIAVEIANNLADNSIGGITPAIVRTVLSDINDSTFNTLTDTTPITDGTVTTSKLADGAVTDTKVTSIGANKVPFTQTGTGAAATTLDAILRGGAYVTPQQFGAVGNGTTDDTAAFQAALNTLKSVVVPYTSTGYKVAGLVFSTGMSLICPRKVKFIAASTFAFIGSGSITTDVVISGCVVDMQTSASGGGFVFRASVGRQWRVYLSDCDVVGSFISFGQDADSSTGYIFDCHLTNCRSYFPRAASFVFYNMQGFVAFWTCFVDHTYDGTIEPVVGTFTLTPPQVTWPGFVLGGTYRSIGYQLNYCSTFGRGGAAGATAGAHGFVVSNSTSPTFETCLADTINGQGWVITNVMHGRWNACASFTAYETGWNISNVSFSNFTDTKVIGVKGGTPGNANAYGIYVGGSSTKVTFSGVHVDDVKYVGINILSGARVNASAVRVTNAGSYGIQFDTCNDCSWTGVSVDNCAADGLMFSNSTRCNVSSFSFVANTGRGATSAGTSNLNILNGGNFAANTVGNGIIVGTGSAVCDYTNNAGAFTTSTVGTGGGFAF